MTIMIVTMTTDGLSAGLGPVSRRHKRRIVPLRIVGIKGGYTRLRLRVGISIVDIAIPAVDIPRRRILR